MSIITIRLPGELKNRIARAAKHAGATTHDFILEAIAEKADLAEESNAFLAMAEARYADIVASGRTIPWVDMQRHLKDRIAGKKATRHKEKERDL